jgi:hypothetical protein
LFGLAGKWKWRRPDPLTRLAKSIEAIGERDRDLLDESKQVDRLRTEGALALHGICRRFVDTLNAQLSAPALQLDPPDYSPGHYHDRGINMFQINLRGRLLQVEFTAGEELHSTEEFRLPYILEGAIRSYSQRSSERDRLDEQAIFCCPRSGALSWHYFDYRTYGTGLVTPEFLAAEMQRLV